MSRPSLYDDRIATKICRQIANGNSLRVICSRYANMPSLATIYNWLKRYPEFAKNYKLATRVAEDIQRDIDNISWH